MVIMKYLVPGTQLNMPLPWLDRSHFRLPRPVSRKPDGDPRRCRARVHLSKGPCTVAIFCTLLSRAGCGWFADGLALRCPGVVVCRNPLSGIQEGEPSDMVAVCRCVGGPVWS